MSDRAVSEAVHCILHTIIFARKPESLNPVDVHCDDFPMSFAACPDREVHDLVNASIRQLKNTLAARARFPEQPSGANAHTSASTIRATLILRFFKVVHKTVALFLSTKDKEIWEEWHIPLVVSSSVPATAGELHRAQGVLRRSPSRTHTLTLLHVWV